MTSHQTEVLAKRLKEATEAAKKFQQVVQTLQIQKAQIVVSARSDRNRVECMAKELNAVTELAGEVKLLVEEMDTKLERHEETKTLIEGRYRDLESFLPSLAERVETASKQVERAEAVFKRHEDLRTELQNSIKRKEDELREKCLEITSLKDSLVSQEERTAALEIQLKRRDTELAQARNQHKALEGIQQESEKANESMKSEILKLKALANDLKASKASIQKELASQETRLKESEASRSSADAFVADLRKQLTGVQTDNATLRGLLSRTEEKLEKRKTELQAQRAEFKNLSKKHEASLETRQKLERTVQKTTAALEEFRAEVRVSEETSKKDQQKEFAAMRSSVAQKEKSIDELARKLDAKSSELSEAHSLLTAAQQANEEKENSLQELQVQLQGQHTRRESIEAHLEKKKEKICELEAHVSQLQEQCRSASSRSKELERIISEQTEKLSSNEEQQEWFNQQLKRQASELDELRAELESVTRELKQKRSDYDALNSTVDLLTDARQREMNELKRRLEERTHSVQTLERELQETKKIHYPHDDRGRSHSKTRADSVRKEPNVATGSGANEVDPSQSRPGRMMKGLSYIFSGEDPSESINMPDIVPPKKPVVSQSRRSVRQRKIPRKRKESISPSIGRRVSVEALHLRSQSRGPPRRVRRRPARERGDIFDNDVFAFDGQ